MKKKEVCKRSQWEIAEPLCEAAVVVSVETVVCPITLPYSSFGEELEPVAGDGVRQCHWAAVLLASQNGPCQRQWLSPRPNNLPLQDGASSTHGDKVQVRGEGGLEWGDRDGLDVRVW